MNLQYLTVQSYRQFDTNSIIAVIGKMHTPQEIIALKQLPKTIIRNRHPRDDKEFRLITRELSCALGDMIGTITFEDIKEIRQKKKLKHKEKRLLENLEEKRFEQKKIQLEDVIYLHQGKVQMSGSQQYSAIDFSQSFLTSSQSSKEKSSHSRERRQIRRAPIRIVQVSASSSLLPEEYSEYQEPSNHK